MPINKISLFVLFALLPVTGSSEAPFHQQLDQWIDAKAGGKVAGPADDAEFVRRVYLDLNGIVPTADDAHTFFVDQDGQKRTKLIDRLLASPLYARRLREAFSVMLLERRSGAAVSEQDWNTFLESSFAGNKPWDQFVRELIQADAANEETRGAVKFFADGGRADHDQLTLDVARLFLGMNVHCAKCHDHPDVAQFKQADYFGLLAYVNQTKPAKHAKLQKTFLVEDVAMAKIEFESVFEPGSKRQTGPRLPGGKEIEIPSFEKGQELIEPATDGLPGVPKFQPRQLLASHLTAPSNRRFVENAVNRFWFLMMGRGLIQPLDMIHDRNPASHPKVLKLLADEFVAHKFDVKWLLRELALSKTYQRSSVLPEGVGVQEAPPHTYRVANPKGLTAEQTGWSVMRVTGMLDRFAEADKDKQADKDKSADATFTYKDYINGRIAAPDNLSDTMLLFVSIFGNPPGEPEVEFQPSMGQALFLMNEPLVLDWLKPKEGNLIGRLEKETDPKQVAERLYINILSRVPNEDEAAEVAAFLEQNTDRRTEAISQYAWAILTSAEFRLNH